jgi:dipeptidyl aminopeptidase/acylaminoacyl peptidase
MIKTRNYSRVWCSLAFFALSIGLAEGQSATSRAAAVLDSMPRATEIDQVAISPDGGSVAYVVNGELTVAALATSEGHAITLPAANNPKTSLREVAWSADSKSLVFLADLPGDAPAAQVWTANVDGSDLVKRADLKGYAQSTSFSPDGSRLAVLFIENMPRVAGPLQPMTPLAGDVSQTIYEQRLAVIDLKTNSLTQITPADVYVYEYNWSPDSHNFAAIAAHGNGDANWWVARLYRVSAETGAMREIYAPKLQMANPSISPDGKHVALIEGLMSDAGLTGGEIMLVPFDGGAARNLTSGIKSSPSALAWTGPDQITFAQDADGNSSFATINPGRGDIHVLWSGGELASAAGDAFVPEASFAGKGAITAVIRTSGTAPPEVWAGPTGNWKQITRLNSGLKPTWGETRNVHWMNGNTRVQGWLTLPKDYTPGKSYPLVVNVHGGPGWACVSHWDSGTKGAIGMNGSLSAMGYFVLCPNPRGSYGQGEQFTQGNVKDFGGGDITDIMTGVDALLREYPIDPKRLGIRGHSYGGYMTMWAETQTNRFAAAAAGAGLSDWLSYYGVNDIDEWMIPFFGASIYDDPVVYTKSEPMHFVKNVKTPTLILVGDRDGEVPMEQSVEWWHALATLNVPVKLVVYPDEGHLFVRPADDRDYTLRTLEWFDEWFSKQH